MTDALRTFIINPHGGWGIRLFMIGAARIFARRHNRHLRIYWDHDFKCPWPFDTSSVDLVSSDEWRSMIAQRAGLWHWSDFKTKWTDEAGASNLEMMAISAAWVPYERLGFSAEDAVKEVRDWIDFAPATMIADKVTLASETTGIHIRRTRPTDYAEVHEIPLDWYVEQMKKRTGPFFLCTDKSDVADILRQDFSIQTSDLIGGRLAADTLLNDLAEIILLSRCKEIIGSVSSYCRFAALYGNRPLILDREVDLPWW